jgi:hypothetical protein
MAFKMYYEERIAPLFVQADLLIEQIHEMIPMMNPLHSQMKQILFNQEFMLISGSKCCFLPGLPVWMRPNISLSAIASRSIKSALTLLCVLLRLIALSSRPQHVHTYPRCL